VRFPGVAVLAQNQFVIGEKRFVDLSQGPLHAAVKPDLSMALGNVRLEALLSPYVLERRFRGLLPRRFGLKSRMNWLLCPKLLQRETVAATEARLAGAHDVLHIDNSIVMR
jgi:hypothetical protein